MSEKFGIEWAVSDGYVGGKRPQSTQISADDLEPDMTDEELENLYNDYIQGDFDQKISWYRENLEEFKAWARENMAKDEGTHEQS